MRSVVFYIKFCVTGACLSEIITVLAFPTVFSVVSLLMIAYVENQFFGKENLENAERPSVLYLLF